MKQLPVIVAALLLLFVYVSPRMKARAPVAASPAPVEAGVVSSVSLSPLEFAPASDAPRLPAAPVPPISPASAGATPTSEPDPETLRELAGLRSRVEWLEAELVLCGSTAAVGPMADWLSVLLPEERPPAETLRLMVEYLRPYPVALTVNEGLWIAERITADDWLNHGPTVDEVLILYLGAARLANELTAKQLEPLLELWDEEGFFRLAPSLVACGSTRGRLERWRPQGRHRSPLHPEEAMPKTATPTPPAPPSMLAKATEVKPADLEPDELAKRCAKIYKLEKVIDGKRAIHELAKRNAKQAKDGLEAAEEARDKEIKEQRFGPGPLFNPSGTGPAK